MLRRKMFGLWFAALSLGTGGVLAQSGGRGKGRDRGGQRSGSGERADPLETSLHEFEEDLKLAPGQEAAWAAYVGRLRALESDVARERRNSAQMAVLQKIDRVVDVARDRLTAVEDIAVAAKALYARLTPEQQEIADPRLANLIAAPLGVTLAPAAERAPRDRGPVSH
jgi:hypothetical protein